MANDFDIRDHNDILDTLNNIVRNDGIAEFKLERRSVPTVVEIKRTKRIPQKDNK